MSTPEARDTTTNDAEKRDTLKGLLFFGVTFGAFIGGVVVALAVVTASVALAI